MHATKSLSMATSATFRPDGTALQDGQKFKTRRRLHYQIQDSGPLGSMKEIYKISCNCIRFIYHLPSTKQSRDVTPIPFLPFIPKPPLSSKSRSPSPLREFLQPFAYVPFPLPTPATLNIPEINQQYEYPYIKFPISTFRAQTSNRLSFQTLITAPNHERKVFTLPNYFFCELVISIGFGFGED